MRASVAALCYVFSRTSAAASSPDRSLGLLRVPLGLVHQCHGHVTLQHRDSRARWRGATRSMTPPSASPSETASSLAPDSRRLSGSVLSVSYRTNDRSLLQHGHAIVSAGRCKYSEFEGFFRPDRAKVVGKELASYYGTDHGQRVRI